MSIKGVFNYFKGIRLIGETSDISSPEEGTLWYNSTTDRFKGQAESATRELTTNNQAQVLTTKTIVVANNTVTTAASGNLAATELNTALAELQTDIDTRALDSALTAHINDAVDAHDASAISNVPSGNLAATDIQGAVNELQSDVDTRATSAALTAHTGASSGVHGVVGSVVGTTDAQVLTTKTIVVANNTITTAASGNLAATELNTALAELQTDIDTRATSATVTAHTGASTGVHGVTGSVVGTTDTQTLSVKTFSDSVTMAEIASPATPSSGFGRIYFKADGRLYMKDDAGTETDIAAGTGGANTALSNLTNPTSINQDLIFGTGSARRLQTADSAVANSTATDQLILFTGSKSAGTGDSGALTIASGSSSGGNTGSVVIQTGTAGGIKGNIDLSSNSINLTASPGGISLSPATSTFLTGFSSGSVLFTGASGAITQDNANLFWDNTNNRLGVGIATPANELHVHSTGDTKIRITNTDTGTGSSAGAYFGLDSTENVYLWDHGNNAMLFGTNNLERMRIDNTGNVGVGRIPTYRLDVETSATTLVRFIRTGFASSFIAHGATEAYFSGHITGNTSFAVDGTNDLLRFYTAGIDRGSLSSVGAWILGDTAQANFHTIRNGSTTNQTLVVRNHSTSTSSDSRDCITMVKGSTTNTAGSNHFIDFYINAFGTQSGYIATNGANSAAFFNTSDRRLKTNIQTLSGALNKIMLMNPVSYSWKSDNSQGIGFLAQELAEVMPNQVVKTDDGLGETLPEEVKPWSMTEGGFVPYLVKAIQELKTELDTVKIELALLKG